MPDIKKDHKKTAEELILELEDLKKKYIELEESENQFKRLTDNAKDMIYRMSLPDGIYEFVSLASTEIFGYSPDEFYNNPLLIKNVIHPDWIDYFKEQWSELIKGNLPPFYEYKIILKSGEERWLNQRNVLVCDEKGDPIAIEGIVTDITESKQMIEVINEESDRFNQLAKQSKTFIWEVDTMGTYTYVSHISEMVTGYRPEELIGRMHFYDIHPKSGRELFKVAAFEVFKKKESFVNLPNSIQTKSGEKVWVKTNGLPVLNEDGELLGYRGSDTDITEYRRTEKALLKNQYYLTKAQEIGKIGTWELDVQKNILYWTDENYKIFGIPPGTKVDYELFINCVHPEDRDFVNKKWSAALNKESYNIVHRLLVNDKVKWVREKADVEFDIDGNPTIAIGVTQDITERIEIEKLQKETEKKLHLLIESSNDMVTLHDLDGRYTYYSGPDKYKISSDDIVGKMPGDLFEDDEAEKIIKHIKIVADTGESTQFESLMNWQNSRTLFLEKIFPIYEENKIISVIKICSDITKQKNAENALKESEEKFRTFTNQATEGIAVADLDGNYVFVNPAFCKMSGYTEKELLKLTVFDMKAKNQPKTSFYDSKGEMEGIPIEVNLKRKDNTKYITEIIGKVITLGNKEFVLGTIRDITERKKIEKDLQSTKERFKQVTEQSPSVYELYDIEGLQIEVNKAYEDLWQFPEGRVRTVGKFNVLESKEVEDTGLMVYVKQAYAGELVTLPPYKFDPTGETESKGAGRVRWLSTKIYPIRDNDNEVTNIVINHEDISDKMFTEEENKKLQDQLNQAQKMEAIGTLARGIAHDFNNILGVIMGYTELTLDDLTDLDVVAGNLNRVMKASKRAKEMVQQILAFSRKSEQIMGSVNIVKIIKETIVFLRSSIPSTIKIKSTVEMDSGLVFGNATQINQVLMNLCTNAAYAMKEEGGVLEIGLEEVLLDKDSSILLDLEPGIFQHLTVSDTGTGISKDLINRIFEPYFTTKKSGEGTGMGLAVIYGIIKNHKGGIKVYSELGKRTVFNVYFPVLESDKTEELHFDFQPVLLGNNENILFIDDEITLVELGTQMLKKIGYRIEGRVSSLEALKVFKANPNIYDLIITDMTMPEMTGVKLAMEIHKIRPDMPIILCTGFSDSINKNNFKVQGISALIMKPVIKKDMAETIREVLDKKKK